jgi:hypothetical protein
MMTGVTNKETSTITIFAKIENGLQASTTQEVRAYLGLVPFGMIQRFRQVFRIQAIKMFTTTPTLQMKKSVVGKEAKHINHCHNMPHLRKLIDIGSSMAYWQSRK